MILARFNGRYDNFGDILIFSKLYSELIKYDQVYLLGAAVPGIDAKAVRFREAYVLALKERFLKRKPVLVIGPPGARFTPKVKAVVPPAERVRRFSISFLWRLISAKFHVAGISVDSKVCVRDYEHWETIGVRDFNSLDKLARAGVSASFCPDMACLAPPILSAWSRQDVLISLRRESPDNGYTGRYSLDLESALPNVMKILRKPSTEFVFYAQVLEDVDYNKSLSSRLRNGDLCKYFDFFPALSDYREVYKRYKFVVSNRLHVLLPAISEGAVPIALVSTGHSKIINLFESYGFEWAIVYVDGDISVEDQLVRLLDSHKDLLIENYNKMCDLNLQAKKYIQDVATTSRLPSAKFGEVNSV
ncbi:polysaccharide pyruvyl transferase family protein [Marinimicrobium alkaliphilum]|uniref:polysaccharide pyruvyl transferase family protein n=1 Tax=Marinimicrobium alkaliphilum TaxID=2202654 RepID=UPI0013006609|nr:polysaccharide pyruvyl transferase family protein [Marinimicrobium alkaliphilum]